MYADDSEDAAQYGEAQGTYARMYANDSEDDAQYEEEQETYALDTETNFHLSNGESRGRWFEHMSLIDQWLEQFPDSVEWYAEFENANWRGQGCSKYRKADSASILFSELFSSYGEWNGEVTITGKWVVFNFGHHDGVTRTHIYPTSYCNQCDEYVSNEEANHSHS